jgi:hypothetical protein
MQYGVDLTHALLGRIQQLVETHGGKLILFYAEPRGLVVEKDEVYVLNGRYYRVSKRQYEANLRDMNRGFTIEAIPVTIPDWRVSVEDGHLNAKATNLVISALAERLRADEGLDRSRTGD